MGPQKLMIFGLWVAWVIPLFARLSPRLLVHCAVERLFTVCLPAYHASLMSATARSSAYMAGKKTGPALRVWGALGAANNLGGVLGPALVGYWQAPTDPVMVLGGITTARL
ncbi:MAG: hypothetical protein CM15mP120_15370 [Pseudomonadota bacterium]|nr:MAG: hypothetical protein CM15mP120_15370 [Pseudomonadota bacterium]